MKAYLEKNGSSWWVWLPADNPHGRVLVRKFPTKRSALAAARIVDARAINIADAATIIDDDTRRGRGQRSDAIEFFAIHFGGNFGLPKPAGWDEAFGRKEDVSTMTRLVYSRSSLPDERVYGRPYWWFHYLVIEDGRVTLIYMKQALLSGMNFDRVEVQDGDNWPHMTAEQIVADKRRCGDDRLREVHKDEAERVLAWLDNRP